jgi:predicted metal-binding membrane protein
MSVAAAAGVAPRRPGVPRVLIAAILLAWAVAVAAEVSGTASFLHHGALIHAGLPLWVALGLFVGAWQLMIVAMMLPSSLPLIRLFRVAASNQPAPGRATAGLLVGYGAVWTAFGALAFVGDVGIHRLVHSWPWLQAHPQVLTGSVLVLAGAFQFSKLKERCLSECRHPAAFLLQHYGRGAPAAFRLGRIHGLFCLGCCWALMLVGFAAGVANLWWMAALTALMVFEKTGRKGDRGVAPIGVGLILAGALSFVLPEVLSFGAA